MEKKFSYFEMISIFMMFGINSILLNTPKLLINQNGTGAFLNSIIIGILALFFLIIINNLLAYFPSSDILDIANYLGGKFLRIILGILFIIIFYLIISIYISQFVMLLKTLYFRNSPTLFLILFFTISIFFCNLNGFGAVKSTISFFFPICIITFILVITNTISGISISKLTPIFGNSIQSTLFLGCSNIFIFTNIILIFLLQPYFNNIKKFKRINIITFIVSWFFLILTISIILNNYPLNNSITDLNPLYTLTRKIKLTNFIERADGLFIIIALISCLSYTSFLFYLIINITKKIFILENEKMMVYPNISFILGLSYLLINSNTYQNSALHKSVFNYTVYLFSLIILFFAVFKKKLLK